MDIALAVEALIPAAEYRGSVVANTADCWDAVVWLDSRAAKPTWNELEAAWEVLHGPTLEEVRAQRILEIDARTAALILAGFSYEFAGTTYHFGYSLEDQGNFTKAALSATLAMIQGNTDYRQSWRGWVGDTPHTLSMTAQEFLAFATHAGKEHQERQLAAGWALTEAVRRAASPEEIDAIVDDRE